MIQEVQSNNQNSCRLVRRTKKSVWPKQLHPRKSSVRTTTSFHTTQPKIFSFPHTLFSLSKLGPRTFEKEKKKNKIEVTYCASYQWPVIGSPVIQLTVMFSIPVSFGHAVGEVETQLRWSSQKAGGQCGHLKQAPLA